jgi:hypothetical protein
VVWQREEHQQVAGVVVPTSARPVLSRADKRHRDATDLSEPCPRMNVRGERDHCPFGIQLFLSLRLKTLEELIPSSSIYVSILEEILILF